MAMTDQIDDVSQRLKHGARIFLPEDIECLLGEVNRLRAALQKIRDDPHCVYPPDSRNVTDPGRNYRIGVTDGHRWAAGIARLALEETA